VVLRIVGGFVRCILGGFVRCILGGFVGVFSVVLRIVGGFVRCILGGFVGVFSVVLYRHVATPQWHHQKYTICCFWKMNLG